MNSGLLIDSRKFGPDGPGRGTFGPFGELIFPYVEMGAINSFDLFGINELVVFGFYWQNRQRYRRALDCGANIGLHSIIMARCGWDVRAFEPDPAHGLLLQKNLIANSVSVDVREAAISTRNGESEFVRVCGNTTGSHLSGAKKDPYGPLERFSVETVDAWPHLEWADLAKIDIEGHEADLITALPPALWAETDAFVEIGTAENAQRIFDHLHHSGINIFPDKIGWQKAPRSNDLPTHHSEGLVFISSKDAMPWH